MNSDLRRRRLNRLLVGRDKITYAPAENGDVVRTERTSRLSSNDRVNPHSARTSVSTYNNSVPPKIQLKSLNLHVEKNAEEHHTDKFALVQQQARDRNPQSKQRAVVRRTQPFRITLGFDTTFNSDEHDLKLLLRIGDDPQAGKNTAVVIHVFNQKAAKKTGFTVEGVHRSEKHLDIDITLPNTCIIGIWDLSVLLIPDKRRGSDKVLGYNFPNCLYVLLNPWSRYESVYISADHMLDEYVLNDSGIIYTGNETQISGVAWNFAQFEEDILEISLAVIRKAFGWRVSSKMADPVKLSRAIAQIVNHFDDGGILMGRWSKEYPGGMRPSYWSGSDMILRRYRDTGRPVRYGQCWNFSGLTTTICRAIGIPTRSVTNYMSAHDTDGSMTIDALLHRDPTTGEIFTIPNESKDSIWNFHVWNDVWMARPDLEGCDGWQAIDATPQERSDGLMCVGPAPLQAIKNGESSVQFDSGFLFAEVNADRVWWETVDNYHYQVSRVDKHSVGRLVVTKSRKDVDFDDVPLIDRYKAMAVDITEEYKHPEGSTEEHRAVKNASRQARYVRTINRDSERDGQQDVECEIEPIRDMLIGSDFAVQFTVANYGYRSTTVVITVMVEAVSYTGKTLGVIGKETFEQIKLRKRQKEKKEFFVTAGSYLAHTDEHVATRAHVSALNLQKNQISKAQTNFRLRTPDIELKVVNSCRIGEAVTCEVSFRNPLPVPLTNCLLALSGSSDVQEMKISDIDSNAEWHKSLVFKPRTHGRKQIVVSIDCNELPQLSGFAHTTVTE